MPKRRLCPAKCGGPSCGGRVQPHGGSALMVDNVRMRRQGFPSHETPEWAETPMRVDGDTGLPGLLNSDDT